MAKQTKQQSDEKRIDWCLDCLHNLGVNEQFGHMYHCSLLSYCVVVNLGYCKADKLGKGKFKQK